MTEPEGSGALVTLIDDERTFVDHHPYLTLTGAAFLSFILGRYAGDEILHSAARASPGMVSRQIEGLFQMLSRQ